MPRNGEGPFRSSWRCSFRGLDFVARELSERNMIVTDVAAAATRRWRVLTIWWLCGTGVIRVPFSCPLMYIVTSEKLEGHSLSLTL